MKKKISVSKRYEFYDKYSGEYLNAIDRENLLKFAQNEWQDFADSGEYIEYDYPEDTSQALQFLKSIYDIETSSLKVKNSDSDKMKNTKIRRILDSLFPACDFEFRYPNGTTDMENSSRVKKVLSRLKSLL